MLLFSPSIFFLIKKSLLVVGRITLKIIFKENKRSDVSQQFPQFIKKNGFFGDQVLDTFNNFDSIDLFDSLRTCSYSDRSDTSKCIAQSCYHRPTFYWIFLSTDKLSVDALLLQ